MRTKALIMILIVVCASSAFCAAAVSMISNSTSAPKNNLAPSIALADFGNGTIPMPMGPIDTPGGPT